MTKVLNQSSCDFPFSWANLESYRLSDAFRCEIYLPDKTNMVDNLKTMFYSLFESFEKNMVVYNSSWWEFCLETWDFNNDTYNYDFLDKSMETAEYLMILRDSYIVEGFSGCCECNNWDKFLHVILNCIVNNKAPYSPIFIDLNHDYFFYFHNSGSIGLYYKRKNSAIIQILSDAQAKFDIVEG